MHSWFQFSELTPPSPGTAASSSSVQNAAAYLPVGVAGPLDDALSVDVVVQIGSPVGGTLDCYVQSSLDELTWTDCVHFPQSAAGAAAVNYRCALTFSPQPASAAPVVVGQGTSPALAANTVVQGPWGSRLRMVFVAGAGTSASTSVRCTVGASRPRLRQL